MKVREIEGLTSLRAWNVFHALMLGLKMLPAYQFESYEEFYARIQLMPPGDQEKMIREALAFVPLELDEVKGALTFVSDANGMPLGPEQMKKLKPAQIVDGLTLVCMEIAKFNIDLISESEKKKSPDLPST